MSVPIKVDPDAEIDIEESFDFYESRQPGLGADFLKRVQEAFDDIRSKPGLGRVVQSGVRKAVVTRFPFQVIYKYDGARVDVISVFHTSRDPDVWKSRI